jgi:predicted AlkP superfamily phosphohydrolase/phosphomutase
MLAACGGGDDRTDATGATAAVRQFDSFEAWRAEADGAPPSSHQVVFIGVDGATWRILDPLINQGKLPAFARLKAEGSYGVLRSTPCFVSPPAWTAMFSGYAPEKMGVYTFGKWDDSEKKFKSVSAADVKVPWVYDVASHAGRKVGATNIPLAYPVHAVNGILISGLLTPTPLVPGVGMEATSFTAGIGLEQTAPDIRSFSQPVKTEGSDSLNTFVWFRIDGTNDNVTNYDRVVLAVADRLDGTPRETSGQLVVFDIGEYSPWMKVRAVWRDGVHDGYCKFRLALRPDGRYQMFASQILFSPEIAGAQYTYPPELAGELEKMFGYYMPTKFLKAEVVPAVTKECSRYAGALYDYDDWDMFYYVFTQTDNIQHLEGFSARTEAVYREIDRFLGELMTRLPDESTLIVASDHGFAKFEWGLDLNEHFEDLGLLTRQADGDTVDFDRTVVFHNMWHLFFNYDLLTSEELAARGVPVAGGEDPADALIRFLGQNEIRSNNNTRSFPVRFERLSGDFSGDNPDAVVHGAYENYSVEFWNLKRPRGGKVWRRAASEAHDHTLDGVYLTWGKHIKRGHDAGVRNIEDITPTILYAIGLPVAADMDGSVIFDAFTGRFVGLHELFMLPDYRDIPRETVVVEEDTEPLEKKLKSLGYVH